MTWDAELVTASFSGVEFQVQRTSDPLMRRWAEHKYPWKDGADIEDMGREPRRTTLTAIFLGDSATGDLGRLMLAIDAGAAATFDHPLLGSWTARARATNIEASDAFRDGYKVELEIVEDGTATELPSIFSVDSLEVTIESDLSDLEDAIEEIEDSTSAWEDAVEAISDAVDAVNDLVDKAKSYAAKVEQALNKVRASIKKAKRFINKISTLSPTTLYKTTAALMKVGKDCTSLAAAATSSLPKMVKTTLTAGQSTAQLAQSLYGEATKETLETLESANTMRNTAMLLPGTALKVPKAS